jgi:phosphoribosyl-AMP cyclohydrolase
MFASSLAYNAAGLIPVIVQDEKTKTVLMFAWADEEAVRLTLSTGFAHYFSRSRGRIWRKGEESGNVQKVSDVRKDCDSDCLLYLVEQTGCACHEGYFSCFFTSASGGIILPRCTDPSELYPEKTR